MMPSLASMPVGFRFRPSDEELINHYLKGKIGGQKENDEVIPEIDVCRFDPWDLPGQSAINTGDQEWFFFSPRNRKYPNSQRSNRATEAGYWKVTGKDRPIKSKAFGEETLIGLKRTLVFHRRAPKGQKTCWIMHEYRIDNSSSENAADKAIADQGSYVLCRLFKQPEEKSPYQKSNEAEDRGLSPTPTKSHPSEVVSEMPSNQTNIEFGTQEDFHEYPVDEVNPTAPPAVIPEGSNLTAEPVDIDNLEAELYLISHSNSFGFENYESEKLNEYLDFHEYRVNEVDSTALPTVILEGSNLTSGPEDVDDLGAEIDLFVSALCGSEEPEGGETVSDELPVMNSNDEFLDVFTQTIHLNSCEFENYESEELTKYLDFHEYHVDEVDSTVPSAMILEGSDLTAEPVDVDDLGAEIDLFVNALCGSEEPEGGETVSDELLIMNSKDEFLDVFPLTSHLNSCGFENYESEELTKYFDSVFTQDDHPCGLNYDTNGMLFNPGMDNTDNRIPREYSDAGISDSVHCLTSSSHNLRKTASKNPVIEHSWVNGYAVIHESLSEGSGKQDRGTGIQIRSRQTKAPAPDFDYELQCSPPSRIRLMKSQPMQAKYLKVRFLDGELLRQRRLSSVAIVMSMLMLLLVFVGWKWISG